MNASHIEYMKRKIGMSFNYLQNMKEPKTLEFHGNDLKTGIEILEDLNERVNKMKHPEKFKEVKLWIDGTKQDSGN